MKVGELEDFMFWFGAASYNNRKVLKKMEEPNVMISYATKSNEPWEVENLFIDSGAFHFFYKEGKHPPTPEYLEYVKKAKEYAKEKFLFASQDVPCEPEILERNSTSVKEHQERSIDNLIDMLGVIYMCYPDLKDNLVPVVQGWRKSEYLDHLQKMKDMGLVEDKLAIGSVCRRHASQEIRDIILAIRKRYDGWLHAFGVKSSVLKYKDVLGALDSADSTAYSMAARYRNWGNKRTKVLGKFQAEVYEYLKFKIKVKNYLKHNSNQMTLEEVRRR